MTHDKLTIIHILTRLDRGGSAQNTLQTCLRLDPSKYQVILIYGASAESQMTASEVRSVEAEIQQGKEAGVRFVCLPSLVRRIDPLNDLRTLIFLFKFIAAERPIIVHTHTSKAGFLGRMAAVLTRTPIIIHTPHGHVFYGHFGKGLSMVYRLLERFCAKFTDKLIALTQGEKQDYIRFSVARCDQLAVIHSGVDIDRFMNPTLCIRNKKLELGLNPDKPVVGNVGWLLPIKGPDVLLNAMKQVWREIPDVQLVYVGKGDQLESLKSEAESAGAGERVKFLGWRDDVQDIMPIFDVFTLPSLNEGMGRVLVEAMAAGKPVVATRTGGIPDLVRHRENGLLVPPGDYNELALAIIDLIQHPEMGAAMGKKGKDFCKQFTIHSMVEQIESIYQELTHIPQA